MKKGGPVTPGAWIVVGATWGVVIGVIIHNMGLGLAVGSGIGAVVALLALARRKRSGADS